MKNTLFTFLLITGMLWNNAVLAKEPLKVFVCAGQSNMVGKRSIVKELPKDLQGAQKNLIFIDNSWTPIVPGKTQKKGFGPEISFAKAISTHLNEPVGIIKYSAGGTNLAEQWSPDNGKLYPKLFEMVKKAQAVKDIEIIGMLWMQGEADSKDQGMAEGYKANLEAFIQRARKDFKSPEMIFIAGRINAPKGRKFTHPEAVRKGQETCEAPKYGFIDCDNLPKVSDNVHYTTKGVAEMGQLFSAKMINLLGK